MSLSFCDDVISGVGVRPLWNRLPVHC